MLAANAGVVLRIGDRIETGLPGRIVYDGVPANLRDRPTLVTELDAARAGSQAIELSYLTGGLAWKADYVAELNARRHRARPERLGDAHQHERHRLPQREAAARRRAT